MANNITLAKDYLEELDKIYQYASKTAILDTPSSQIRPGVKANEILIAKMSMQGLGDYDRTDGYKQGDVTLEWETHQFTQDRARKFAVDSMDNLESANMAFGMLAGEFIRTKTTPEFDAYRMASYAAKAGTITEGDLTTGEAVLTALDVASEVMDEAEVPEEGRILFISNTVYRLVKNAPAITRAIGDGNNGTFNRDFTVFDNMKIQKMPKTRFYTAITQYDGETTGQEAGGYVKAAAGRDQNFMIVHPSCVMQTVKHSVKKIITPDDNQISDAWLYYFRAYHDALVYDNKTMGIYSHHKTS